MFNKVLHLRIGISVMLLLAIVIAPTVASAQDLFAVSSITGSSSVFVFRNAARAAKRFVATLKPTRTRAQRLESVAKIKRQYDTIARTSPKLNRAKIINPYKLPANVRTLPAGEGSKLFAGVGEYYIDKKDYQKAIEYFTDANSLDPNNPTAKTGFSEALAMKGTDLLVKEDTEAAKIVFLEALKYDPKNSAAYFGLGEVYAELDQAAEAIANYEKSLQNDNGLTEIYVPLGILYFQSGEIAKADDFLTKALATSSESSQTQFFLGMVRSSQNRNEDALAAFKKAETLEPTYAESYFNAGDILVRLKRAGEAVAEYQKALELKPAYFDAWLALGEALYETGKYSEAIIAYKAAAKLKNDKWEVFMGLAEASRQNNEFNSAESNYNLAALFLMRNQEFNKETAADIYSKIGYVIGRQCEINTAKFMPCKWPLAVKSLEKAVELGGNPLDNANLGWAYYNNARMDLDARQVDAARPKLELAKATLQKALAVASPAIVDGILQNLGAVQIDLGEFPAAIESLKPVVEKQPEWNFSRYALGTAYFKVNDFDNAAKTFRALIDKDPKNVAALSSLGYVEIKRKNGKEVKRIVEMLRPLSPGDALKLEQSAKLAKI
ncbi:MAG: tetratricopeptide repeat protein [Pyrinomonadaceae bacterium]